MLQQLYYQVLRCSPNAAPTQLHSASMLPPSRLHATPIQPHVAVSLPPAPLHVLHAAATPPPCRLHAAVSCLQLHRDVTATQPPCSAHSTVCCPAPRHCLHATAHCSSASTPPPHRPHSAACHLHSDATACSSNASSTQPPRSPHEAQTHLQAAATQPSHLPSAFHMRRDHQMAWGLWRTDGRYREKWEGMEKRGG